MEIQIFPPKEKKKILEVVLYLAAHTHTTAGSRRKGKQKNSTNLYILCFEIYIYLTSPTKQPICKVSIRLKENYVVFYSVNTQK